jgi:hypothetical protein
MSRSLARILRLRALVEEESRLRLEKLAHQAHRVENAQRAEQQLAFACRASAFLLITDGGAEKAKVDGGGAARWPAQGSWLAALADQNMAALRQEGLRSLAKVATQQLEAGREEMLQLRRERRQMETLVRNEEAMRETELDRRRQRSLDDWYAATLYRKMRRRPD